jgi:S1-C subfamily serine protease
MHCHQVNEAFYKAEKKKKKEFSLAKVRYLPLAEDIGVTISIDKGNVIDKVVKDSAAAKAGLRAGDTLRQVRGTPILSQGDLMWTLKYGPSAGPLPLTFQRGTETLDVVLDLPAGWKDSPDLSWRKSAAKLK